MSIKNDLKFPGIPNEALKTVLLRTMNEAAMLQAAGVPLPEFKRPKKEESKLPPSESFRISTAGLADYLRVSLEITQMAADLRRKQGPPDFGR